MLKATVLIDNLKTGISFSHHAISSRSPLPILLNFLLEAKDGNLIISATDLEIGIQCIIPAKIENEGSITVPAKTFLDLVNSVDSPKIELEEKEGALVLSANRLKTQFSILSATEFPKLYEDRGEKQASFKKNVFDTSVSRVVFAAAQDSTRPALSGVLVEQDTKGVRIVATDGYRLSLKKDINAKIQKSDNNEPLLVSARVIREVLSAKSTSEEMSLYTASSSNQILFELGENVIVGRLIEAEYPDYNKIIPQDSNTKAEFDRQEALNAVRSCSVFAREAANIIKITIGKEKITFSASASGAGRMKWR